MMMTARRQQQTRL